MRPHVLVVDDEELIRWSLVEHLGGLDYRTGEAGDGEELLSMLETTTPDLILLDLKMPKLGGLDVLREMQRRELQIPVIVITAYGGLDTAIEATRLGASNYLTKPFDLREVTLAVEKVIEETRLRTEVHYLRSRARRGYGDFIGTARALEPVYDTLRRLEAIDAPTVLILGESGSGKDVIARMIHQRGPRTSGPFLEVDCAALPDALLESELFGHERGAFTDAHAQKRGLLEVAAGGVVFLDELGELSPAIQAKLLRALETRTFRRVGGTVQYPMDVAILAATHRDLEADVASGRFRKDLYFRLNVVPIRLPALRERREDIPSLVSHFTDTFNAAFGRRIEGVSGEAMALLQSWKWPGNVRELRNVIERLAILGPDGVVTAGDLPAEIRFQGSEGGGGSADCPFVLPEDGVDLEAVDRGLVRQAIARTGGNQSAAARLLGISRYALRYRLEKYDMKD
jgi:DNA-binding NtrC family response regulator